ncbi:3-deoxy-7-phosphoheptulonate synthase [Candidatus Woesearchaeota archaeon]|nr:3-deoxy-7-phosphoheptulonate synthase [Candidatus Woesearchaeota archaeon]
MVVFLDKRITDQQLEAIKEAAKSMGLEARLVSGSHENILALIGDERGKELRSLEALPGVRKVMPVEKQYKIVSRDGNQRYNHYDTKIVNVSGVKFGAKKPVMIAGPCAVESLEQVTELACALRELGVDILRGGAYKPRTSPYDFQGLGEAGLKMLKRASEKSGLPIVTEVLDTAAVEQVAAYADMLQIGTRNMWNYALLSAVGKTRKPILLKRGLIATMTEWLCAAEYIAIEGNSEIVLCARGVRTGVTGEYGRNHADWDVIFPLQKETYLPVIADPSHCGGLAERVPSLALSALACGAQGLIIETIRENAKPEEVKCDYKQGLRPSQLRTLLKKCADIRFADMRSRDVRASYEEK